MGESERIGHFLFAGLLFSLAVFANPVNNTRERLPQSGRAYVDGAIECSYDIEGTFYNDFGDLLPKTASEGKAICESHGCGYCDLGRSIYRGYCYSCQEE